MRRDVDPVKVLTKEQLAAKLGVSPWTIWSWVRKGQLPKPFTMVPGSPHRWRERDIAAWLDDLQRKPRKAKLRGALAKLASGRAVA
jgi:predicted DNA-binding transcriptional regulator AlpA